MSWTHLVSGLMMTTGVLAGGVGALTARQMLQDAGRAHARIVSRTTGILESWDAWFLGGFSRIAMGVRWLFAMVAWIGWTLVGMGCIGLGIQLLRHL